MCHEHDSTSTKFSRRLPGTKFSYGCKTNKDYPKKKNAAYYKKKPAPGKSEKPTIVPKGSHRMPGGSIMKDSDMKKNKNKK